MLLGKKCQISPLKSKFTGDQPIFFAEIWHFFAQNKTLHACPLLPLLLISLHVNLQCLA
jgi:hypothetical protein